MTDTSDISKVHGLLSQFDATTLGDGDIIAGMNVLAAMAIPLPTHQN